MIPESQAPSSNPFIDLHPIPELSSRRQLQSTNASQRSADSYQLTTRNSTNRNSNTLRHSINTDKDGDMISSKF